MSRASEAREKILAAIDLAIDGLTDAEQDEVLDSLLDFLDCYRATETVAAVEQSAFEADFPLTEFDPMAMASGTVPDVDPSLN